jgi:hypothetical protein
MIVGMKKLSITVQVAVFWVMTRCHDPKDRYVNFHRQETLQVSKVWRSKVPMHGALNSQNSKIHLKMRRN